MDRPTRIVNFQNVLRSERARRIEFWRDNGDGTVTRVSDGLTLTYERYNTLPAHADRRPERLRWDD